MNKRSRALKRQRDRKYKRKLKRIHEANGCWAVQYLDDNDFYRRRTITKPYYRRMYRGKTSSYCKKRTNKIVRHYQGEIHRGCSYRRLFDMWWELY